MNNASFPHLSAVSKLKTFHMCQCVLDFKFSSSWSIFEVIAHHFNHYTFPSFELVLISDGHFIFFFKNVSAILGLLLFHINFKSSLPRFTKGFLRFLPDIFLDLINSVRDEACAIILNMKHLSLKFSFSKVLDIMQRILILIYPIIRTTISLQYYGAFLLFF